MPETPPAPQSIGRYKILAELGRGSMARVYLAIDPNIDRKLALKVLDPKDLSSPHALEEMEKRFLIEATAAARLDHPAAVAIYDADVDPETGASYIAMEWVDGTSLKERLSAGGPLPLAEAVDIAYQVAGALDAAHRQGLIHRDIKPANILINRQGRAKLSDFGIAKLDDLELTTTGQVLGTPLFMSPEQIRDGDLDGRSDLFSLGVLLYQCLTGEAPFHGETVAGVTHRILTADPRPLKELIPEVSEELAAIVERLLAKDRDHRFSTAAELSQALAAAMGRIPAEVDATGTDIVDPDQTLPAPPPTRTTVQKVRDGSPLHFLPAVVGVLMVAVLVLLVGLRIQSRRSIEARGLEPLTSAESSPVTGTPGEVGRSSDIVPPGAAAPPPTPDESTARPATANAYLEILHTNRLKNGMLTVWIDGERVASRPLQAPRGFAKRVSGEDVRLSIPLRSGQRRLEIRITGAEGKVDAFRQTDAYFSPGQTKRLRVGWLPTGKLRLNWK